MSFFQRHRYRKFMILSSPRSGTHMLRTSLDSHRNVVCLSEMFNPDYTSGNYDFTEDTPEQDILERYIFVPQRWRIQAVGFCLHRSQSTLGNWPRLWETVAAIPDLLIVSLHRKNFLRRYLSFELRPRRNTPRLPSGQVVLDRNQLIADFQHQEAKINEFDRLFHDHPMITLTYEDLCANWEPTMQRLQRFLKIPCRRLRPETPKLITQSLPEIIHNYRELKQEFAGTEWAGFFDD